MKTLLKAEEMAQLALGVFLFSQLGMSWWWFIGLFLVPDIGMLGYIFNAKIGAATYNFFHHKGLALLIFLTGVFIEGQALQLCGIILFSHASFDRMLGYGLKYPTGFEQTHLGDIGN